MNMNKDKEEMFKTFSELEQGEIVHSRRLLKSASISKRIIENLLHKIRHDLQNTAEFIYDYKYDSKKCITNIIIREFSFDMMAARDFDGPKFHDIAQMVNAHNALIDKINKLAEFEEPFKHLSVSRIRSCEKECRIFSPKGY